MNTVTLLAIALSTVFAVLGAARIAAVPAMRVKAANAGFDIDAYRRIGVLEVLGAAGLLVGLTEPFVGALAAAGLLLLLGGAVGAHLLHRDGPREAAPAVLLSLTAVAYLVIVGGAL